MKKINLRDVFIPTLTLFIICFISAAALGITNFVTADKIAANNAQKQQDAMKAVLLADSYDKSGKSSDTATLYVAKKSGAIIGYVASAVQKGYGGDVSVMVGIGTDGKITKIEIVSADDETPGLGQRVKEDAFKARFSGVSGSVEDVSVITGASISSRAVKAAVSEGLKLYESEASING